jgi:hypothetical protein
VTKMEDGSGAILLAGSDAGTGSGSCFKPLALSGDERESWRGFPHGESEPPNGKEPTLW